MTDFRLPAIVQLPTVSGLDAAQVRAALGNCNRQRVFWLRKHHGFPPSYRGYNTAITATANVAAWLVQHANVKVEWV